MNCGITRQGFAGVLNRFKRAACPVTAFSSTSILTLLLMMASASCSALSRHVRSSVTLREFSSDAASGRSPQYPPSGHRPTVFPEGQRPEAGDKKPTTLPASETGLTHPDARARARSVPDMSCRQHLNQRINVGICQRRQRHPRRVPAFGLVKVTCSTFCSPPSAGCQK